jgi:hypothetical protein
MENRRMWNIKCMIVPVIIGGTGMATKRLKGKIWKLYRKDIQYVR